MSNDLMHKISQKEKWTIADTNKIPIDFKYYMRTRKPIGAKYRNNTCLSSLAEVQKNLNIEEKKKFKKVFFLDCLDDEMVCLDIEPKCSETTKRELLENVPYVYGEVSMSGKGYHLFCAMPPVIKKDFSELILKPALKEEQGHFEILQRHYVTFTGKKINESKSTNTNYLENLYRELAKEQNTKSNATKKINYSISNENFLNLKNSEKCLQAVKYLEQKNYKKTLNDFSGDYSKYEFGFLGSMFNYLNKSCYNSLTETEQIFVLAEISRLKLEYRSKHSEKRDGLCWLTYNAKKIIERG